MIDRRTLIAALAAAFVVVHGVAQAQTTGRVYRLGILGQGLPPQSTAAFEMSTVMRNLGYVEGTNLVVESRYANGALGRLPELARELVQQKPDVIVAVGSASIRAVKDATTTIPTVMWGGVDPVAAGFVQTLARPGGNLTGILIAPGLALVGKKIELLKEMVPGAMRIAFLSPDNSDGATGQVAAAREAAATLKFELVVAVVRNGDYDQAFDALVATRPSALLVANSPTFMQDSGQIIKLATKHRLPGMFEWPEQVEGGGLMAYGPSQVWVAQRVATYVDLIFKGARPAGLPVEQPTKLQLTINMKTAKAFGLTIPPSLLLRADEVIQ